MWMTYREAVHVARIVFGTDNDDLFRDFLALITPQMVGEKSELVDTRRIDMTEYLHLSVVGYHQSQARGGNNQLLIPIPGQTVPPEPVPLPPNRSDLDRMQDILNSPPPAQGGQMPLRGGGMMMEDAYDPLDEEEREYEEEFRQQQQQQGGGRGSSAAFERVAALPLEQQLRQGYGHQPSSQQQAGRGDDSASGLRGYDDINDINDDYNDPQQQPEQHDNDEEEGQEAHQPNAFEEQQQGREMEFMSQLYGTLVDAPPDIYQYVEAQLWENLHQTVTMLLADKEISDLDTLDAALLEILSLDQLRVDMEGMRDELLEGLMPSK